MKSLRVYALAITVGLCTALAPLSSPSSTARSVEGERFATRRTVAFGLMGSIFGLIPGPGLAADDLTDAQKEAAEAARERMKQRIADSKKNYRKTSDLVKERKVSTDYSCVADTGSPCPEPPKKAE